MLTRRALFSLFQTRISPTQIKPPSSLAPVVETPKKITSLEFDLSFAPIKPHVQIFLNGLLVSEPQDYTLTANKLKLIPFYETAAIDDIRAYYLKA